MKVVVVGNGPAAISAIETMRSLNSEVDITLISKEKEIYSPCLLPYFLSGDIDEERLRFRDIGFYERMRLSPIFRKAERIDPNQKLVFLTDSSQVRYDKLLIATGSLPVSPKIDGMDKEGVFFFHNRKDAKKVVEWGENCKKAVVVGAGFIGIEVAIALQRRGIMVSVVEVQDRVLPEMVDKDMAEKVKRRLEENAIQVILESQVAEVIGNKRVKGVTLDQGTVECEMVIISAGVSPNIEIVKETEIKTNVGIIVDKTMRASVEDVYAAGDVAEAIDIISKERTINPIWPNAVKEGRVAGYNLLGIEKEYELSLIHI